MDCRNVRYIKVETLPITTKVADMVAAAGGALTIFGGAGGSYFIEEMRRGANGTMPFCSQPAAFVETWHRFRAGDEQGARKVFDANHGGQPPRRAGRRPVLSPAQAIAGAPRRDPHRVWSQPPTITVDPISQREIDELIEQVVEVGAWIWIRLPTTAWQLQGPAAALGFGGAPIGNLFGPRSAMRSREATLDAAWAAGVRFYDTSPFYGRTLSEHRHRTDAAPPSRATSVILSTKVGRLFFGRLPIPPSLPRASGTGRTGCISNTATTTPTTA